MKNKPTKEERNKFWEEQRRKNLPAKKEVEIKTPSIRFDDKGNGFVMQSWGQELPAHDSEIYFWELLQYTKDLLTKKCIIEFCKNRKQSDDDTDISVIENFILFVNKSAKKAAENRATQRINDIIESRKSINFYEELSTTMEDFEK